ncbi:MAG TPA: DUF3775 domain-containing protein [Pirellulales bacterium]|jgi:hypothetical protein|nr:DUF3775 domain-containing protein [Pirellulales bacterium]
MNLSEIAKHAIGLAETIQTYWAVELPKRHREYPIVHKGESSGPSPPEEKELSDFLSNLPGDLVYKLILIMYLGRGDFDARELPEQYEAMKETFKTPEAATSQLLGNAPLAEYLSDGLAELAKNGIDVDNMTLDIARSRR